MPTAPPAELLKLIETADLEGVDRYLQDLDSDQRTTLRGWFERGRPWFRQARRDIFTRWSPETVQALSWVEAMCAISLMGPATAAKRLPWRDFRWYADGDRAGEQIVRHRLQHADPTWAARFVEAADGIPLSREGRPGDVLARLLRATVLHHKLPCPSGSTFLASWLAGSGELWTSGYPNEASAPELAQALRHDPLMPELLWHYLGSGHCGDFPRLPDALAILVAEGRIERSRLIETVLLQLTTLPRAATQRVLANILVAVAVTTADVPGGLDYLLGVIATAQGSVGKVLLPLAIETASGAGDLLHLAGVVAARPERAQKDLLVRALRDHAGQAEVVDALQTLSTGDDDTAFVVRVQQVITSLARVGD